MLQDKVNDALYVRLKALETTIEREGVGYTTITDEYPNEYIDLLEEKGYNITKIAPVVWKVTK